ncbi:rhamnulokinase [Galbitalea soli]|uniref:Rhamnulokinase n=1 Tax=Galbitalea soli TaxID=1268042 RepID=A0A7C9PPQ4_9MICO|nr:rhamnulokinase family protein [Galbitalea soli]NEM92505.1 rhamnulokinase [Galbitalea soli]NYJ29542.1 rhamnulokinase [Galbitalea soli]
MTTTVAAVDLGATSGRVMLGRVSANELHLEQLARFPNGPVAGTGGTGLPRDEGLHWDVSGLYRHVLGGLTAAAAVEGGLASIGIDAWAVDYGLLRDGRMLGEPFHYRDERTVPAARAVHAIVPPAELYARNGLQFLSFNTLYQLTADRVAGRLEEADSFLLVPDLLRFWLTGELRAEATNASTTGLLDVSSHGWDLELADRLGLARTLFPRLVQPGERDAVVLAGGDRAAFAGVPVTAVGSHDTASAVVAVPATGADFAYISCGTWGLVGVELDHPVLTEASRAANFTNEGGVDGRVRFLHNVMGLWLLSETVREWEAEGSSIHLPSLLAEAAAVTAAVPVFDADDPVFLAPGDMPGRIAGWLRSHGLPVPASRAEFVRCIIESLAEAFAHAVHTAAELSGTRVGVVHIVGGGSLNALLCQLTADRTGLPVLAGPVEATAIGNVLVQARALGVVAGDLESLRAVVAAAFPPVRYAPRVRVA